MENENLEQLTGEPEIKSENAEGSIYGKFKDAQSLLDAYNSLQSEFTRKSQKLADLQKQIDNHLTLTKSDSIDEILNDSTDSDKYKKEITKILENDKELSNLSNKNRVAFKIIKEAENKAAELLNDPEYMDKYINSRQEIKDKIITNYLSNQESSPSLPKVISGNASNIYFSPSISSPKTLKDAGEILTKMLN